MRTNKCFWLHVHICMCTLVMYALVVCTLFACDGEETDSSSLPGMGGNGVVSFSISGINGEGSGDSDSPVVVEKGDTLNMTISQTSNYTDSDGSVLSCEPKAKISLYAKLDTLYVKDIKTLVSFLNQDKKTSQSGTLPLLQQTLQTFNIGGQEITFDLAHEIYTLTNRAGGESGNALYQVKSGSVWSC